MPGARLRTLLLAAAVTCAAAAPGSARAASDSAAATPGAARGPRVPGTTLRMSDSLALARGRPELRAVSDPDLEHGQLAYGGTMRFYGSPADAKLVFAAGRLVSARFEIERPSPRTRAYVEDDLRRLGYRERCRRAGPAVRDCDWFGPIAASVRSDSARLVATFGAPGATIAGAGAIAAGGQVPDGRALQAILASDTIPVLPDTLDLREDNPNGYARPTLVRSQLARIPDEIRTSVERGVVKLLAFVGAEGQVQWVEAYEGPEDLRQVAADALRQYRFARYETKDGRWRFWVRVSIFPA